MTFTYDETDLSTALSQVRLLIGDTDSTNPLLSDEEITFFLTRCDNKVYCAASQAARAISGNFAREADSSVESVREASSQKSESYAKLADRLDKQSAIQDGALGKPFVGGVSLAEMKAVRADPDRFPSSTEVGGQDNPPRFQKEDNIT